MPDETLATATVDSPFGVLTVVASAAGVRAVLWPGDDPRRVPLPPTAPVAPAASAGRAQAVLRTTVEQLERYFAGDLSTFDVALDLHGTAFQLKVWRALAAIPYGTTTTYAELAEAAVGDRRKARAVGGAVGRNPVSVILPCHRVVGSGGALTGFAGGIDAKRTLLALEGALMA